MSIDDRPNHRAIFTKPIQNQLLVDMHADTDLVTYIDMHLDRPLDFQSVDVRNPHIERTYAHYSVITTEQVNPRLGSSAN